MTPVETAACIERLAYLAWPAEEEVESASGWMLRHSPGITARRINSATSPLGDPGEAGDAEQTIRDWFAQRGSVPIVRQLSVSEPRIDQHFDHAGWVLESPTIVMTTGLRSDRPDAVGRLDPEPSPEWIATKQRLTGMTDTMIATWLRRALEIRGATGFASSAVGGRIVSIGLGVVDDDWLGLFDLNTDRQYRRRGLAAALVTRLEDWAAHRGCRNSYLQVEAANTAAVGLYTRRGYDAVYDYWYRRAPLS